MSRQDQDLFVFYVAFALVAAAVLLIPGVGVAEPASAPGPAAYGTLGWRILGLVFLYNVALPVTAWWRAIPEAASLWRFLVPLSVFQVVPDAFLADVLGVLVFPDTGGPKLGPVPLALAGMWTIPLFGVLWLAQRVEHARGLKTAASSAALMSAVVFALAESTLWAVPIWYAEGVHTLGPLALFLIPPEALLGVSALLAERWTRGEGAWTRVGAAALVSVVYLGALASSYYLIEGVL